MYAFLNLEPVSCSTHGSTYCFLTCIHVSQQTGKMVWHSHLSKSFPQLVMIHRVKGFRVVGETKIDAFMKCPCFLYNPVNAGNLISSSSSFSKPNLNTFKLLFCIMLKPSMNDFKHDLTSMRDECNCSMVSIFLVKNLPATWETWVQSLGWEDPLEKGKATPSNVLTWRIP